MAPVVEGSNPSNHFGGYSSAWQSTGLRLRTFVVPLFEANAELVYNANVPNTDSSLSPLYAVMSWECGVRNSPGLLVISSLIMAPFLGECH